MKNCACRVFMTLLFVDIGCRLLADTDYEQVSKKAGDLMSQGDLAGAISLLQVHSSTGKRTRWRYLCIQQNADCQNARR